MDYENGQVIGLNSTRRSETAPEVAADSSGGASAAARRAAPRRIHFTTFVICPLLLALACAVFPPSGEASPPPYRPHLLDLLPSRWIDDSGQQLSLTDFRGRPVIITMAYTNCRRTCSTTILRLQEIQRILDARGKRADFVIVSYDPGNDDAPMWTQFRKNRNLMRPNWHFLTGSKADTRRIARLLGLDFWTYDDHILHDFNIVVLNAEGALDQQIGYEPVDLEKYF